MTVTTHYLNWPDIKASTPDSATTREPPSVPLIGQVYPLPPTPAPVLHLHCGHTSCDLRVSTYKFVWEEDEDDSRSDSISSSGDKAASCGDLQDNAECPDLQDSGPCTKSLNTDGGGVASKREVVIEMLESKQTKQQ